MFARAPVTDGIDRVNCSQNECGKSLPSALSDPSSSDYISFAKIDVGFQLSSPPLNMSGGRQLSSPSTKNMKYLTWFKPTLDGIVIAIDFQTQRDGVKIIKGMQARLSLVKNKN